MPHIYRPGAHSHQPVLLVPRANNAICIYLRRPSVTHTMLHSQTRGHYTLCNYIARRFVIWCGPQDQRAAMRHDKSNRDFLFTAFYALRKSSKGKLSPPASLCARNETSFLKALHSYNFVLFTINNKGNKGSVLHWEIYFYENEISQSQFYYLHDFFLVIIWIVWYGWSGYSTCFTSASCTYSHVTK